MVCEKWVVFEFLKIKKTTIELCLFWRVNAIINNFEQITQEKHVIIKFVLKHKTAKKACTWL